jgi:GTP-binding protein
MIEECIVQRKSKKIVYIIIDAFVGPMQLDFDMIHWLNDYDIPFKIIANKCDKISKIFIQNDIKNKTAKSFGIDRSNIFAVSAKKRNGFNELQFDIVKFLTS